MGNVSDALEQVIECGRVLNTAKGVCSDTHTRTLKIAAQRLHSAIVRAANAPAADGEDVALLRRLAMYRESEGRQFEAIRGDATEFFSDAARLRALAFRLEEQP